MSNAETIRLSYGVPARTGMRVTAGGRTGTITGFGEDLVKVRLDGEARIVGLHPTRDVTYLPDEPFGDGTPRAREADGLHAQ